ncbi:deoxyribose-phosphate aldolase [Corynebacterium bovis]|uniref:deoxyribose-phosphate aldolase n=1 Tax=Corynebacterium bovis TaxID=36808 RepID=UPI0025515524|nr:deoxyribose-phosphate aldolase [Corynebacterium bovis]MDK8510822.1 deoxyribose-phosphate aldolase [Corynebacterium bovis]
MGGMISPLTRDRVASLMDATLLTPQATRDDVRSLQRTAVDLGCGAVCVSPSMLPLRWAGPGQGDDAASPTAGTSPDPAGATAVPPVRVATVVGFPSGAHQSLVKATEARFAVEQGADEIDMVITLANAVAGDMNAMVSEIVTVREAVPFPVVLKVIVESALLTEEQLRTACRAARTAGADFVKTSTGFHPAGGATVEAVRIMAEEVGGVLGVKASGGIRDWATAVAMVEAGATRLGVSAPRPILAGAPD